MNEQTSSLTYLEKWQRKNFGFPGAAEQWQGKQSRIGLVYGLVFALVAGYLFELHQEWGLPFFLIFVCAVGLLNWWGQWHVQGALGRFMEREELARQAREQERGAAG